MGRPNGDLMFGGDMGRFGELILSICGTMGMEEEVED